jgi:hypothetical protein
VEETMTDKPLTAADLAEALDCFWNGALGAQQNGSSTVTCIVFGVHAVANRLHEIAKAGKDDVAELAPSAE